VIVDPWVPSLPPLGLVGSFSRTYSGTHLEVGYLSKATWLDSSVSMQLVEGYTRNARYSTKIVHAGDD